MRGWMDGMKFCREGHALSWWGAPQAHGWVRACYASSRMRTVGDAGPYKMFFSLGFFVGRGLAPAAT